MRWHKRQENSKALYKKLNFFDVGEAPICYVGKLGCNNGQPFYSGYECGLHMVKKHSAKELVDAGRCLKKLHIQLFRQYYFHGMKYYKYYNFNLLMEQRVRHQIYMNPFKDCSSMNETFKFIDPEKVQNESGLTYTRHMRMAKMGEINKREFKMYSEKIKMVQSLTEKQKELFTSDKYRHLILLEEYSGHDIGGFSNYGWFEYKAKMYGFINFTWCIRPGEGGGSKMLKQMEAEFKNAGCSDVLIYATEDSINFWDYKHYDIIHPGNQRYPFERLPKMSVSKGSLYRMRKLLTERRKPKGLQELKNPSGRKRRFRFI